MARIAIVGGGPGGLMTAYLLERKSFEKHQVTLFEATERARRRRGWVVGEAVIDADIPLQRVGTQWPLP